MIKLENIYAKSIIPYDLYSVRDLMKKHNVKSLVELQTLIKEYPERNWDFVLNLIYKTEKRVDLANKHGNEPQIYSTKGYSNSDLKQQDEMNTADILLLNSPIGHKVYFSSIKHKPISLIKEELTYTVADGRNCFIKCNRYMGISLIDKIISAIEMYEEQIERQSKLTTNMDINIFNLDKYDKQEIVIDKYKDIIMYLIENSKSELVWESLSDAKKEIYLKTINSIGINDIKTRNKVISYIANYTTLPELEKVADNDLKVLKRFIKK